MPAILPNVAWRGRYCASRRFGFVAVAFDPSSAPFHAARTLAVALGGRMQPVPGPICHQNMGKASRRSIRPLREGGGRHRSAWPGATLAPSLSSMCEFALGELPFVSYLPRCAREPDIYGAGATAPPGVLLPSPDLKLLFGCWIKPKPKIWPEPFSLILGFRMAACVLSSWQYARWIAPAT